MPPWEEISDSVLSVSGLLQPGQEQWLYEVARDLPGGTILEIGPWKGRSTCALALGCQAKPGPDHDRKHIYSIDPFRGESFDTNLQTADFFLDEFLDNLRRLGVADWVTPLTGRSDMFYSVWRKPLAMLWIDGGHELDVVRGDFHAFFQHLRLGGLLAMHDVTDGNGYVGITGPTEIWETRALPQLERAGHSGSIAYGWKRDGLP